VLEIGAGIGNLTKCLIPRARYVASDINVHYLDYLKRCFLYKQYLKVEAIDLNREEDFIPYQSQFDTVICVNVLFIKAEELNYQNIFSVWLIKENHNFDVYGHGIDFSMAILLAFFGIGLSIQRLFGQKNQRMELGLSSFWIGWAFVLMILQLWYFVVSIDLMAAVCVILLGAAGLLWNGSRLSLIFRNRGAARSEFIMAFCMFAIWLPTGRCDAFSPMMRGSTI